MLIVSIEIKALTALVLMDTQVMVLLNAGTLMNVSPKLMIVVRLNTVLTANPDTIVSATIFPLG